MDSFDIVDKVFENATKGNRLIKNSDVLKLDYIPNKILYRDIQTEKIASVLSPVLNMIKPSNLFIYGKTGTGKTAVVRFVLKKISQKAKEVNSPVKVCFVNCRLAGTEYRILAALCSSISEKVPFTGLAVGELFDRFRKGLE
ncbi:MAG: AAA family ATPase, partial [Conexivisphaerales archaeon]